MTTEQKHSTPEAAVSSASLPFLADAPELLRVRILPAEFARLLGVSKQTVSRWIKESKVTVNPLDGRLDVQAAVQQVLRNTDPGRLRARILRQAVEDVQQLRTAAALANDRVLAAEAQLAKARKEIDYLDGFAKDAGCMSDEFVRLVAVREADFRATKDSSEWRALIGEIENEAALLCHKNPELFTDDITAEIDAELAGLDDDLAALQLGNDLPPMDS